MKNVNSGAHRFNIFRNIPLLVFICFICLISLNTPFVYTQELKKPNVSGAFYPADPKILSEQIETFLKQVIVPNIEGKIIALICPHAGYSYSGAVAAYGFKTIQDKEYKTIVVIAPSHYYPFRGISVWPKGRFRTPLGDVEVDSEFASSIIKRLDIAQFIPEAFAREHSLEVQLPFLQMVQKNIKIVPIVMGSPSLYNSEALASVLKEIIDKRNDVLIIASTDLSHYHGYKEAKEIDEETIRYLENLDFKDLWSKALEGKVELCGLCPVMTVLAYAKANDAVVSILKYANSGDVTGDLSKVVGYASAIIYKNKNDPKGDKMLSREQKEELLRIARESMQTYLKTKKRKSFSVDDPELKRVQGAFVTLNKSGHLRGCIGRIVADTPLYQVVADMAIEAAVDDPRFPPVRVDELKDIEIEISVLTPLEQVSDIDKIEVGKHGILIRQGLYSGLLLPQVATEYKWDRDTFLDQTCRKAGLPYGCWQDKTTQIFIFSAEVFSEESVR